MSRTRANRKEVSSLKVLDGGLKESLKQQITSQLANLAVVFEPAWIEKPVCPHCDAPASTKLDWINDMKELSEHIAEIMQCPTCQHPYLVLVHPRIYARRPVYLKWETKVPEGTPETPAESRGEEDVAASEQPIVH